MLQCSPRPRGAALLAFTVVFLWLSVPVIAEKYLDKVVTLVRKAEEWIEARVAERDRLAGK